MCLVVRIMKTIIHVPHASLDVPEEFYDGLLISKEEFHRYNTKMSDIGVDELFKELDGILYKAKYSRLYCDVERFRNDEDEIMSKYGEGVVYTNTYDGLLFHQHNQTYKDKVLEYYDAYHKGLDDLVKECLSIDDELLILDCHSYGGEMARHFFKEDIPFPDVCIGIEPRFFSQEILDKIIEIITSHGLTYAINYPYKGSLVPNCVYNGIVKGNVYSFMLEVNKRVYL